MLPADRDDALGGLVIGAEISGVALADGLLQLDDPAGRGVLGEILIERADGGLLDVVRGREVGLAGSEVDDVNSLRAQLFGIRRHFHRGGDTDQGNPFR